MLTRLENRILLLSLERSPAGMNLVCCHHLVLVHPMLAESKDASLSFERQAIGRVRRQGQKEKVHVCPEIYIYREMTTAYRMALYSFMSWAMLGYAGL